MFLSLISSICLHFLHNQLFDQIESSRIKNIFDRKLYLVGTLKGSFFDFSSNFLKCKEKLTFIMEQLPIIKIVMITYFYINFFINIIPNIEHNHLFNAIIYLLFNVIHPLPVFYLVGKMHIYWLYHFINKLFLYLCTYLFYK